MDTLCSEFLIRDEANRAKAYFFPYGSRDIFQFAGRVKHFICALVYNLDIQYMNSSV